MSQMFRSINSKILSAQLLIALIALFSLGIAVYVTTVPYINHIHQEKSEFIATTWANNIERLLSDREKTISTIADSEVIEAYSTTFNTGLLSHYLADFHKEFALLAYLNEEGREDVKLLNGKKTIAGGIYHSKATTRARQTPNEPVFEIITVQPQPQAKRQAPPVTPPYIEFAIYSQNFGEFTGLIVGQLPIQQSIPELADFSLFRFAQTGFLSLYDVKGKTLLTSPANFILQKITLPEELSDIISAEHNNTIYQRNIINGIDSFSTYAPVHGAPMIVSATIPYDQFQQTPNNLKRLFITLVSVIALVCIIISIAISRSIAHPILRLSKISSHLAQGQWDEEIEISGSNETAMLGRSFKQMSQHLHQMILSRDSEIELRKQVEEAIKLSHLELDQIFNNAAGGKLVIDLYHKVLRVNNTFLTMMGFERQEVLGKNCHDLFHDTFCGTDKCIMEQVVEKNCEVIQEVRKTRKDGAPLICTLVAVPFYGNDGDLIGIIEDFRDITRTKKAEELLKISESRYRLLFDSAPDGIAVLNNQGVIIDCNPSLAKIHKRPRTELIGHHFTRYNTPESKKTCHSYFKKLQESKQEEGEVNVFAPDNTTIIIWRKGTTITDKKGYFTGVLIYDRDITKQKKAEELQDDMARIARHDLKTPLNGVINLPTLIKMDANLTETQVKRLDLIEEAGYKILRMINASLDLYKMEQGTYEFTPTSVDLSIIVNKIKEDLWSEMQTNQNSIKLLFNGKPTLDNSPVLALGDELLCYSMLANILKNAVESSPKSKEITVSFEISQKIAIKIHNYGKVPLEIQNNFFKKYSTSGKSGGTGLGTYSARLMARTQGGDILMNSSNELGTTLAITLPSATYASQENEPPLSSAKITASLPPPADQVLQKYNVLLAEDDPINRTLATALLRKKEGFEVTAVNNGREAIEAFETKRFDLILMDMQMPEVSGQKATARIRQIEKEREAQEVPVIAITGMVGEKQSAQILASGVNDVIAKPIKIDLLWQTIAKYLNVA